MNNFRLVKDSVDTDAIKKELAVAIAKGNIPASLGPLLRMDNYKTFFGAKYVTPHKKSSWLRLVSQYSPYLTPVKLKQACSENSQFLYTNEFYRFFSITFSFLKKIAEENSATLQRVTFARLLPNENVLPHTDVGEYFKYRDRYHLVIDSKNGSEFTSGNEKQIFSERELWWFANKEVHSVKNLSDTPRLHIIFDLLPNNHFNFGQKIFYKIFNSFFQNYTDIFGKEKFAELVEGNSYLRNILLKW